MKYLKEAYALPKNNYGGEKTKPDPTREISKRSDYVDIAPELSANEKLFKISIDSKTFLKNINTKLKSQYDVRADDIYEHFWWLNLSNWIKKSLDRKKTDYSSSSFDTEDFDLDHKSTKGKITYSNASISYLIKKSSFKKIKTLVPEEYSGNFKRKVESQKNQGTNINLKIKDIVDAGIKVPGDYFGVSEDVKFKATKKTIKIQYSAIGSVFFEWTPEINGSSQNPVEEELEIEIVIERTISKVRN
ncbi:hypothetical protein [uncultured Lacinutrix sp.]|uniref:hypothetical protein n=1 Tax=uncultured Lacinutrix sp. TaxID=574032 RepID=UPI00262F08AF|nr:hypothetical protein [uncultured Lacinutrix sp.]